jgi:hypothetical protein
MTVFPVAAVSTVASLLMLYVPSVPVCVSSPYCRGNATVVLTFNRAATLHSDISFNIITEIPAGTFTQLVDLENLNMNGNRLSALPDNTLSGPRFLRAM